MQLEDALINAPGFQVMVSQLQVMLIHAYLIDADDVIEVDGFPAIDVCSQ